MIISFSKGKQILHSKKNNCGVLEKYTHRGEKMNNKKEAKKSRETSRKTQKTGRTQKSYDDKFIKNLWNNLEKRVK